MRFKRFSVRGSHKKLLVGDWAIRSAMFCVGYSLGFLLPRPVCLCDDVSTNTATVAASISFEFSSCSTSGDDLSSGSSEFSHAYVDKYSVSSKSSVKARRLSFLIDRRCMGEFNCRIEAEAAIASIAALSLARLTRLECGISNRASRSALSSRRITGSPLQDKMVPLEFKGRVQGERHSKEPHCDRQNRR